ncbi:sensor histidine kinase [Cryptosporangium sp. NPDC051539]|uniref:sensor histidine kinase n=1 Tax=Cryptosporangium sp. NPDC051539 TaxID=3363962 RepID=UPI00379DDAB4
MSQHVAGELAGHPVIARLLSTEQRLRRWGADHSWAFDTVVVLVTFMLFCAPDLVHAGGRPDPPIQLTEVSRPVMLLFQLGLLIPLWWRRRAPLVALHVVTAVFGVQWAIGFLLRADVAVLIAIYSVVKYERIRRVPLAAPVLLAGLVLATARLAGQLSLADVAFVAISAGTAAAALGFAVRIRRAQLDALRERAVRLEIERDQRSRLAAATERTRVAREMHDIVGHSLSVIITLADGGAYAADVTPERSKQALQLIGDTGRRSLGELRRILGVLREQTDEPELHPQPGIADLDPLCQRVRDAGAEVEYHTGGDLGALDLGIQLAVYRIVQEALTNALRHAGPQTRIHLTVRAENNRVQLVVRDSGRRAGATPPPEPAETGHGLIGMRERAALYGGSVTVGPADDGGWIVQAVLFTAHDEDPA